MKQFALFLALLGTALCGTLPAARAQTAATPPAKFTGKLATDPAQYILDVQAMMASTNNAAARAAGSRLQELWGSRLTAAQKTSLIALSQTMLEKKFRARPHFELLFGALAGATSGPMKLGDAQLDQYLDVLTQTLNKEKTTETEKFLTTSHQLLTTGYLYKSGFNGLKVLGGNVSFAYSPIDAPEGNFDFGAPTPAPKQEELPPAPKPAPKAAPKKAAPKPKPKPKPKKNDGWDTADLWTSPSGGGWGDDDGWGPPAKKTPAKKPAAKAPAKAAAKPVASAPAQDAGWGDEPATGAAAPVYSAYYPPPTRGAVLVIKDADLLLSTSGDSVTLHKVSGTAAPNSSRFVASAGTLDWTISGNPVSADLGGFDFDLSKPEFKAEPVTLTYPAVLDKPVKGALSYKSTRRKPGAPDNGYPRFISLTNDAVIKTLGPNISYVGGISLAGSRMLSAALDESMSRIVVSLDGEPKFRAASRAYILSDTLISAARATVTIYEGKKDSIYHPGASLRYVKAKKLLKLDREEGMYKDTPYADSYHQLDIRAHQLSWVLDKPEIDFAVLSSKNNLTADFESREFFANTRYQQIKGYNKFHPLQMLVGYSQDHGNAKTVNVSTLAEFLKTSESNMRSSMGSLASDGYVKWEPQTGNVTILPKGYHYVGAGRGKKDFDHIAIKSLTGSGRNATLDLNTNELLVRGVDRFNFSDDTATVYVRPDSSIVRIGKNRDLKFGGTVVASAMRFKGHDFKFDYNGFYVDMEKIDSMVIRSKAKRKPGKAGAAASEPPRADFALTNAGKPSSGRLYINNPRNRSGRKKMSNYPSFDSKTGANVFFGKQDVLGGAYDSTMVFDIPPFKLDSLNNIGKSASGFDGVFKSGGILPDIKTKLSVQDDGSLGFVYDAPKEGFSMYKGRGRMTGKVKMDGKGLQIVGTVKYGAGTFTSDDFVLYRDSVVAVGKTGTIAARKAKGVDIPKMALPDGYLMKWEVRQDSMYLTTPPKGDPIKLFANEAAKTSYNFTGTALLTKTGAGGSGKLDGPQSFIKSPEMTFRTDGYSAKRATLAIKSAEPNKPALTANNVTMDYELKKGYADFSSEGSKSTIDLPYSQFKTTLSGGRWDLQKKQVQLRRPADDAEQKTYFYSTNPEQGLRFEATEASYDLAKYSLDVRGVPHIASIDAWIVPDSGRVSVLPKGKLRPLRNATVLLDSLAKFHRLYKGNIKVESRMAFSGDALYRFKTTRDSFAIKFANFTADSSAFAGGKRGRRADDEVAPSVSTAAMGSVDSKSNFQLAPRIGYRGDVALNSQRRGLVFDGQVQLQFGQNRSGAEWFAVKDSIDPKNIALSLNNLKAEDGTTLVTGLFMSDQSNKVYPLYVAAQPDERDVAIFTVDGKLRYDERKDRFTIARHDADDPAIFQGSVMTYDNASGQLGFRGPMKFISSKKEVSMVGSGVGTANPDSARYDVDALMGFDIQLPGKAVDAMAKELEFVTKQSPEAQDGSTNELYKLGEFIGSKGVEAYTARRGVMEPIMKLSPKLAHTILLSRVNLKWDDKRRAWYSVGQIGLAGVGKTPLNALINGFIEIKRDNGFDWLEMYLEAEPQVWYYFKYFNGKMLAKAQNEDFDAAIGSKSKGNFETTTDFGIFLGEYPEVDAFRTHFKRDYLGLSGKELNSRPAPPPRATEPPSDAGNKDDRKSKKKKKGDDAFGDDSGNSEPPVAPEPEPSRKRKKDKNDPFGGGDDAPAPTPPPAATTPPPAAAKPTPAPATAPPAAATPPPAAAAPPTDEPLSAKEQEKAAKEAEKAAKQAAKDAEKAAKEAEKAAKEEEKRKKEAANDPFGGS